MMVFNVIVIMFGVDASYAKSDFNIWKQKMQCVLAQQCVFKAIDQSYVEAVTENRHCFCYTYHSDNKSVVVFTYNTIQLLEYPKTRTEYQILQIITRALNKSHNKLSLFLILKSRLSRAPATKKTTKATP